MIDPSSSMYPISLLLKEIVPSSLISANLQPLIYKTFNINIFAKRIDNKHHCPLSFFAFAFAKNFELP